MVKLFKCPMCGEYIHTLSSNELCTRSYALNLETNGSVTITSEWDKSRGLTSYVCPHCKFTAGVMSKFIAEVDCDCDHEEEREYRWHDGWEYSICKTCGIVMYSESAEEDY